MKNFIDNFLRKYDISFFLLSLVIFTIGILNLYSATHDGTRVEFHNLYKDQIIKFIIGLCAGLACVFIRPKNYHRFSYMAYILNILLLVAVLVLGKTALGAKRWLVLGPLRIQPSEFMKICLVFALARWYSETNPQNSLGLKDLFRPFLISFLPAILIIVEPDLGTGLLILLIFLVISFYRRLRWKTLFLLFFLSVIVGSFTYKFGLKDYQKKRILTFMNPRADAHGSGYNAIQSEIAIGSGQLFGKGYMKSSQASLNFLPENHTDFVFSIYNEEHGLIGAVLLVGLYILLIARFIWLSTVVSNLFDSIVVIGLMSIFFWHTIINMGMVTGLLPIVGLPLPFMSYGGSSLLTFSICCGVATSISNSKNMF